ncbi:MAG: S9 family peptidase, partial [Acidobacteria bacterium]|nr:S9 family peptidase [Acidobacteriota bacterium]
ISYIISKEGKSNFYLLKLKDLSVKEIPADIKNLTYYRWIPSGEFIVIAYNTESKPIKEGVNRIRSINDRDPSTRSKTHISMLDINSGALLPIATGLEDTQLLDISADGKKLILAQETEDYTERTFSIHKYYILNLETFTMEQVISDRFAGDANFSPDGESILVIGGPSFSNSAGKVIDKDKIPNDYDAQAYIVDLKSKDVKPISREFDPAIDGSFWSKKDGNIYFKAGIGQYTKIFKYDVPTGKYAQIDIPIDVIRSFDIADNADTGICFGTSADYPNRVFTFNIVDLSSKLFKDPMKNIMNDIKLGKVEDWHFTNKTGYTIEGRIHFPPNFDESKKWPLIVYYYGGTSPVEKTFGGRYPFNWYAANGFVVYVLQPRGCTGYGQEFSAFHVNDWGKYGLEDIIEGTEKFIEAHKYINSKKIGCIGASYGGFTTEYLITRTDMYAAAISHAGISQLASYWGGGYWGVTYSSVATANKYPWNAREIYVERSALYNADKIHTPLLLLHGDSDTNVPTHESDYLYSALKILGRDVELIKVVGEDHWVLDNKNRIIWYKTIIAWFNKYLKDKPEYWQFLYPPITEE